MAASGLTFINAALTRTGSQPITSLTDALFGAQIAAQNYELLVAKELAHGRWKFATKSEQLNLLTAVPSDLSWAYGYQLPTDLIDLRTITTEYGNIIGYERQADKIFCNFGSDTIVLAKYIWRVLEPDWPAWFGEAITQRLEAMFLRGRERHEEAAAREKSAHAEFSRARTSDAQAQSPRDVDVSPTLNARRGYRGVTHG